MLSARLLMVKRDGNSKFAELSEAVSMTPRGGLGQSEGHPEFLSCRHHWSPLWVCCVLCTYPAVLWPGTARGIISTIQGKNKNKSPGNAASPAAPILISSSASGRCLHLGSGWGLPGPAPSHLRSPDPRQPQHDLMSRRSVPI